MERGGGVTDTPRLHPVSLCPDVVSVSLFIHSQYAFTPTPDLPHSLIACLPVEPLTHLRPADSVGWLACVFVYIVQRMLPKQDMPNSVEQPWTTIVFFFLLNIGQFLVEKKRKMPETSQALPVCMGLFLFFFSLEPFRNIPELSRVTS